MAFCPHCEAEIMDEVLTCPACGRQTNWGPLVYADFWSRVGGLLIDSVVVGVAGFVLNRSVTGWFASFIIGFLYHWLTVAYWNGQSVGRKALSIRVARPDGSAVDSATAAGRAAMRIVSGFAFGLGFLWAAWDPEKRTWHDMVANTRVYRVVA